MKYNMSWLDKKSCETKYNCDEIYILFADDDDYFEKGIVISENAARFIIRNIDSVKEYDYTVNYDGPDSISINWNPDRNVAIIEFIDDSTTVMFTDEMILQFQTDIMKLLSGYTTKIVRIE